MSTLEKKHEWRDLGDRLQLMEYSVCIVCVAAPIAHYRVCSCWLNQRLSFGTLTAAKECGLEFADKIDAIIEREEYRAKGGTLQ